LRAWVGGWTGGHCQPFIHLPFEEGGDYHGWVGWILVSSFDGQLVAY